MMKIAKITAVQLHHDVVKKSYFIPNTLTTQKEKTSVSCCYTLKEA